MVANRGEECVEVEAVVARPTAMKSTDDAQRHLNSTAALGSC